MAVSAIEGLSSLSAAAFLLLWGKLLPAVELVRTLVGVVRTGLGLKRRDIVLDFSRHCREGRLYVLAHLGRGLQEADAVVVGHLEALVKRDDPLVLQVGLVANQDARNVVLRVLFDLAHPSVNCAERVTVGDVVRHDDAVRALVVARGDCLEPLLTCCVPNLQLAHFLVNVDRADFEVHANRGHKVLLELVILRTRTRATLALSFAEVKGVAPLSTRLLTANRRRRQDLPTPEFPIINTLNR